MSTPITITIKDDNNPVDDQEAYELKKKQVEAKLNASIAQRNSLQEKNREKLKEGQAPEEDVGLFSLQFLKMKSEFEQLLDDIPSQDKKVLPDSFDSLSEQLQAIQKYLNDSVLFLPPFELRNAQEQIKELDGKLYDHRTKYMPKKKFSFAARRKQREKQKLEKEKQKKEQQTTETTESESSSTTSSSSSTSVTQHNISGTGFDSNAIVIRMKSSKEEIESELQSSSILENMRYVDDDSRLLVLNSGDVGSKDVVMSGLSDVTVVICDVCTALRIDKLTNCRVYSGPVDGSAHIEDCTNCVFILGIRQLRIHTTFMSEFHIAVMSNPIIEGCKQVLFGPYALQYNDMQSQFDQTSVKPSSEKWKLVDDFLWLREQHSPNWREMDVGQNGESLSIVNIDDIPSQHQPPKVEFEIKEEQKQEPEGEEEEEI